jgi:hypothetical protein
MGETASQIENHIEETREDLGSNLHELEERVKRATDWRLQFKNNPSLFLAVAFGAGLLIARMTR